jgi:hypothetical protein
MVDPMKKKRSRPLAKRQPSETEIFLMGVRCGSVIASLLVEEGWKQLDKLPDEVVGRVTGRRRKGTLSTLES